MKAVVLAAGFGTRLGGLGEEGPKALLPVGGTPLKRLLDEVAGIPQIDGVFCVTNQRFFPAIESFLSGHKGIVLVNDLAERNEKRLGAIKDLEMVISSQEIDDDLLVLVSDRLFTEPNLEGLCRFFQEKGGLATLYKDVRNPVLIAGQKGCLVLEGDNVLNFEEKPKNPKSSLASVGISLLPRKALSLVREYLKAGNNPDSPGFFLEWFVKRGGKVFALELKGECIDLGTRESFEKALEIFGK